MKKRNIKKMCAVLVVLALLFTAAGCRKNKQDDYSSGYDIEYVYENGSSVSGGDNSASSENTSSGEKKDNENP